jgi:hypothetical protein
MLYNHRVYFTGQEPIGFDSVEVLNGLREAMGADNLIYIEEMELKPFIDTYIEAMKTGVIAGFSTLDGGYYIEEGEWKRGDQVITEVDVRRELQSFYKEHPEAIEEDSAYIEDRRVVS